MPARPAEHYTVALQGFSEFERGALASFFRLAAERTPSYEQVDSVELSDFVIADADHPASMQTVQAAGRQHDTVFVGARAPLGAMAWLPRPIEPVRIVRELDSMVEQRNTAPGALAAALAAPVARAAPAGAEALQAQNSRWGTSNFGVLDAPPPGSAGPDVLVAEDSGIARRFLQMRLQRLGYNVHLASDAETVMTALRRQRFAMVFLDVVLGPPGSIDGFKICQQIKQHPRLAGEHAPKVVIVTGLTGEVDRVRGSLAGCDAYLTKPLLEPEFMHALQSLDPGLAFRQPRPAS
jgi:CheY-like chemotaxis protein